MQLSKSESRYRIKFLQENHLNKGEQAIFEKAKMASGRTYKDIYKSYRKGEALSFMLTIYGGRIAKATAKVGLSAMQASEMILRLNQAVEKVDFTLEI